MIKIIDKNFIIFVKFYTCLKKKKEREDNDEMKKEKEY